MEWNVTITSNVNNSTTSRAKEYFSACNAYKLTKWKCSNQSPDLPQANAAQGAEYECPAGWDQMLVAWGDRGPLEHSLVNLVRQHYILNGFWPCKVLHKSLWRVCSRVRLISLVSGSWFMPSSRKASNARRERTRIKAVVRKQIVKYRGKSHPLFCF